MFWETIERVNRLRQQAMSDPAFLKSAEEHAKALESVEYGVECRRIRKSKAKKPKSLADIYDSLPIGENPSGTEH